MKSELNTNKWKKIKIQTEVIEIDVEKKQKVSNVSSWFFKIKKLIQSRQTVEQKI